MSLRPRVAWDSEWVKTSMLSQRFKCDGHCELCGRLTAGPVWHSIKSGRSRCGRCFNAEEETMTTHERLCEALRQVDPSKMTTPEVVTYCSRAVPGAGVDQMIRALRQVGEERLAEARELAEYRKYRFADIGTGGGSGAA